MYIVSDSPVDKLIKNLQAVVGRDNVLSKPDELLVYECDGLPHHKYLPQAVVFPSSTVETSAVMRVLGEAGISFTPRGAGTGLSGGALTLDHGVVVEMAKMRRILKIDEANRLAVVQPGVVNAHVSRAVAHLGLHYVPDPSSQPTCTIGGNIAESAGGVHCLKYGTTTDHVLGVRAVLAGGEVVDLGGAGCETAGYDLLGVFVGSEGTFGIATEATLRLVQLPPTVRTMLAEFDEVNAASHAVSAIIAAGVMPAGLEMMDREIIRAVEASVFAAGLSLDIGAALLIELDGVEAGIDEEADRVKSICLHYGARACRMARDENERKKLWAARKGAFGAIGRISPDSMIQDAVVPRSRLPEVLDAAYEIASKYQLRIANVFHAGDGNLHPLICFDSRFPEEVNRVKEAGRELMETCVKAGGTITGEHGVGFDKRELLSLIFSDADLETMLRVRAAFDPSGLCNPGKIIPMLRGCGEAKSATKSNIPRPMSNVLPLGPRASRPLRSLESSGMAADLPHLQDVTNPTLSELGEQNRYSGNGKRSGETHPFDPDRTAKELSSIVSRTNISVPVTSGSAFPTAVTVTPDTVDQICGIMKLASARQWAVVPAGAGNWLDAGNPLKRVDVILSTEKLNRIIEHEPADLVAITEAGTTLQDFNEQLGRNGQWLPIDPPDHPKSRVTIGGVVATGLGGAQQVGYGPPRRHVIGMKVVLSDGNLIKVGGRVVKNVAGYDLSKLFTGSYGTLGVIAEVNFKLRPIPAATTTVLVTGTRKELIRYGLRVIDSRLFPVGVELLSPGFEIGGETDAPSTHQLLIRFAGSANTVARQTRDAIALRDKRDAKPQVISDDESIWSSLASCPLSSAPDLIWRVGLKPADVELFISKLMDTGGAKHDLTGTIWQAGLGDGRIRVMNRHQESEDDMVARFDELQVEALRLGCSVILEKAPAALKARRDAWGTSASTLTLMKRVKQQLDPTGILSPERFAF
jgi:glycolate oxidase subunit GlcD